MSKPKSSRQGPRRPIAPWLLCTATSKARNGEPCKNPAVFGSWTCAAHGGAAPQVQAMAQRRIAEVLPFALQRLVEMLSSADDRVVLVAAKDLIDRAVGKAPTLVEMTAEVTVTTPEVETLLGQLAQQKAISGPSREEQVIEALAQSMGLPEDMSYDDKLRAVHDATVGVEGEVIDGATFSTRREGKVADQVEDAVIVEPTPAALPPARPAEPDDTDTLVLTNGQRWSASALSPGGGRRVRERCEADAKAPGPQTGG